MRVAALWRDDDGHVVAAVFDELASVDIGVASEFSLRLPRNLVPAGDPDTIVVSAGRSTSPGIEGVDRLHCWQNGPHMVVIAQ